MNILNIIISIINALLGNKPKIADVIPQIEPVQLKEQPAQDVDWTDHAQKVSQYFTVHDCLWLPTWNRLATADDGLNDEIKQNLKELCAKMDIVREYAGNAIITHVTLRPEAYNKLIGGAPSSNHIVGKAMDFNVEGISCDDFRDRILKDGKLEEWNMRMEDRKGSNWVHLDMSELKPGGHRFFLP